MKKLRFPSKFAEQNNDWFKVQVTQQVSINFGFQVPLCITQTQQNNDWLRAQLTATS